MLPLRLGFFQRHKQNTKGWYFQFRAFLSCFSECESLLRARERLMTSVGCHRNPALLPTHAWTAPAGTAGQVHQTPCFFFSLSLDILNRCSTILREWIHAHSASCQPYQNENRSLHWKILHQLRRVGVNSRADSYPILSSLSLFWLLSFSPGRCDGSFQEHLS